MPGTSFARNESGKSIPSCRLCPVITVVGQIIIAMTYVTSNYYNHITLTTLGNFAIFHALVWIRRIAPRIRLFTICRYCWVSAVVALIINWRTTLVTVWLRENIYKHNIRHSLPVRILSLFICPNVTPTHTNERAIKGERL